MRNKALIISLAAAAALAGIGGAALLGGAGREAVAQPAPFAMPVPVVRAARRAIPLTLDYPARAESIRAITLQAKVGGYVQAQAAPDGADVREGDLLYRLDPRDFQAAYDRAQAQVDRDLAALDYAQVNYGRGDQLARSGWLARDTSDQRSSTMKQAVASLAADRAAGRSAQLDLGYTEIRAPFAGRLGRDQAPVGTLVSVGGTVLNTLVQLDPIYVTFNPGETDLARLQQARARGPVTVDVLLPGEAQASHHGTLSFVDNAIDRSTGTVAMRATIANGDFLVLPGQYVQVRVHVGTTDPVLTVPRVAVGASQLGQYVYAVGADGRAEQHLITLGPVDGDVVAVASGLPDGAEVITGNLQKIGPGAPVRKLPPQ